ncbi:hypothetical protein [Nocardia sp. BMG51109]|uniref:hypothetical protein n=1 Tax=Nocardia sp. BMG51109 TaxID=1056816 RepID=UPI0012ECA3A2|nr:hypothetical protein [Nocardia sp. BMG51109]
MAEDNRVLDLRRRGEAAGIPDSSAMTADELSRTLGKMAKGIDAETAKQAVVENEDAENPG